MLWRVVNPTHLPTLVSEGEVTSMTATSNAVEHCKRHIERTKAEIERRETVGRDAEQLRDRLKTLQAILAAHRSQDAAA
jgi:predicted RNase H-related nuclease YkuK (DUF458 family)